MKRASLIVSVLIAMLALFTSCSPVPQATQPTLAPPTAVPAPTNAPTPTALAATPALIVATTPTTDLTAKLDKILTDLAKREQFSGAILVMHGDEVILRKGYGYADDTAQTLNTPETVFRIGSLTQPFTAAAILLLESQGKLSVQDSVCTYVDSCPAAWKPLTLHHLLSGSSGIPNYRDLSSFRKLRKTAVTPDALIQLVRDQPLLFSPGSQWGESDANYVLLGLVIERVSGQPYATFLQEQIFGPLKMTATSYAAQPAGLATGYQWGHTALANSIDVSTAYAAYGLSSTVDDLYRWDRALFADTLLPHAQREAMLTAYTNPFPGWHVGYGVYFSDTEDRGHHLVLHGLDWNIYPGFAARNWSWADIDTHVVLLSNVDHDLGAEGMPLVQALLAEQ